MKLRPRGFIAICQCQAAIGAMDYLRTDRKEAGSLLGKWLADGCAIQPQFNPTWSIKVEACRCKADTQEGANQ